MFVNRLTLPCAVALLSFVAAFPAPAQTPVPVAEAVQSLPKVRAAAEAAVHGVIDPSLPGVSLKATTLDPRLRLAGCAGKLQTFANAPRNSQSRVIARVSCASPAWTLNVPVDIRRTHSVLVLRRAVGRGEAIAGVDVAAQRRELPGLESPFLSRPEDLTGRLTRRPLPEGTTVTAESLSTALLIKRSQQVTLVAQSAGFEIRAPGKALADAAAGQRVRVQNLNSLKIVEGVADNDSIVRVSP